MMTRGPALSRRRTGIVAVVSEPSFLLSFLVVVIYLGLAVVAFLPVLPFDNAHILSTAVNDSTDVGWFLSWVGFATSHAHNPFFSSWMEYPTGINIPANQSMPLLGVLSTPITEWLGPFAMINLTMRLSFAASATAMYFSLRSVTTRRLAAFIGGLFYGFCPFLVAHNLENQNFSFLPALPVIFLFTYKIVSGESVAGRRDAIWLGIACAVQLYLNPEPLAEILVVLGVTAVIAVAWRARRMRRRELSSVVVWIVTAGVVFLVLALPFAYYYLRGPQHTSGPVVGLQYLAPFHTDLAQLITPDNNQLIGTPHLKAIGDGFGGALNEAGSYLGITLIIGLVVLMIRYWANRLVRFSALALFFGVLFSLGPELYIDGHATGIPLPARLLLSVPVLNSAETIRYFVVADVAAAFLLGVGLDAVALDWVRRRGPTSSKAGVGRESILVVVLAAVMLFPLIPKWPYPAELVEVPAFFTTSEVDTIAPNATVLTYPIAQSGAVEAMQWQMAADFRFKMVSGYGYVANDGGVTLGNPPMNPPELSDLENVSSGNDTNDKIPAVTLRNLVRIRKVLKEFGVDDFLMLPTTGYQTVESQMSIALGGRPQSVGGMLVWYNVPGSLKQSLHNVIFTDRREGILSVDPPVGT